MPSRRTLSWTLLAVLALVARSPDLAAQTNWPQWRGPSGQGYTTNSRVPLRWSEKENLLWQTTLPGFGNSTPIVWGDRIFLTAASNSGVTAQKHPRPDERYVLCVRTRDGKRLWQRTAARGDNLSRTHEWNGFASPSCVTDGTHVYAFFGTPGLFCYDFDGNLVWKHTFGIFTTETGWGTGASPVLFEDLVIQNCDNDGARALPAGRRPEEAAPMALVALDKKTGTIRWQTSRNQGRGFSTPRLIVAPDGRTELVLNGPHGVWAYDPRTGKDVWHCTRVSRNDSGRPDEQEKFGEPMPVNNRDTLFAASGRPGPFQAIRLGGTGDVTKTGVLWEVRRRGHRDVASPILWEDAIYAADNKGFLTCHDARTGKVIYNARISTGGKALASPVAVRGKLLFLLDDGTTVVIEPGRTLKVIGTNKLGEEGNALDFAASPAVADGRLYLRSQSHLYCIGTPEKAARLDPVSVEKALTVRTPEEWAKRRAEILERMQEVMGPLPDSSRKVPLAVEVTEVEKTPHFIRKKLTFASEKDDRVPAYLLLPVGEGGKRPAVLCLHQTNGKLGKAEPAGIGGRPNLHYAQELAERGYVTLAPDYPNFGDYHFDAYAHGYQSATMKAIWNNMRAIDLLQSLPEVDPERIGCIGHSLGGHNTMFTAAFDQRIKALVSSCGFTSFPKYYGGNLKGWSHAGYMPRIATVYDTKPEKMPFDFPEVVAAFAPRAFFTNSPLHDDNFEVSGVRDCIAAARPIYELLGAKEKLAAFYPDCKHDFPPEAREKAYAWLDRWLK